MPSLLETTQPTNAFFLFPYAGALFTLFENTHSPDFVSTITLVLHLALLSITKDQKELCIGFEKKYYFWNEVSLRLKAFKIKWSIEQHFRQIHASKNFFSKINKRIQRIQMSRGRTNKFVNCKIWFINHCTVQWYSNEHNKYSMTKSLEAIRVPTLSWRPDGP